MDRFNNTRIESFDNKYDFNLVSKADMVDLRILPLGASITWGLYSSTGNG